ncbi:hypothetical protein H4V96_000315 [Janthinobacterium sp. CG_23.4]|nr:hypothetical protein [Janthinobacterium sp. CG_23.4]
MLAASMLALTCSAPAAAMKQDVLSVGTDSMKVE